MLARIRRWWGGRSRIERLLLAVGVPVAAIAALWGARQDRGAKGDPGAEGADAEGGPGVEATVMRGTPGAINVGAPGVGTSDLASFTEVFSGEIGSLEGSLAGLEKQFGDTTTERAKADAEIQAQIGELTEVVAGIERPATTTKPAPTTSKPAPGPTGGTTSSGSTFWHWLVSEGLISGDPTYYSDGRADAGEYVHAMRVAASAAGTNNARSTSFWQRLVSMGAIAGDPTYYSKGRATSAEVEHAVKVAGAYFARQ